MRKKLTGSEDYYYAPSLVELHSAALYLTTRVGWTNYSMLASKRKYVLLAIFVIAAILTPPDVVSQVALGVPLYVLYEVGIQVSRFAEKTNRE